METQNYKEQWDRQFHEIKWKEHHFQDQSNLDLQLHPSTIPVLLADYHDHMNFLHSQYNLNPDHLHHHRLTQAVRHLLKKPDEVQ